MKIVKLTAENFMRLVAVEITPQGNTILITGKNGAGKSAVLEIIRATFGGKKYQPAKPIRDGEDHAEIVCETEQFIIKRTFTAKGGGATTVMNADGMKATSPQGLLEKFYDKIAFRPMDFYKDCKDVKKQREQLYMLMKLVGLDFDDINADILDVKRQRSTVKTSKETYDFEAGQIPKLDNMPTELVSMTALTEKLTGATQHNEKQAEVGRLINAGEENIYTLSNRIKNNKGNIATLKEQLAIIEKGQAEAITELEAAIVKQNELGESLEVVIDVAVINDEIKTADAHNDNIRLTFQRNELLKKSASKSREFAKFGKKIKTLESKKAERLAAAKMPIEGLSVNEETILFDNIPLAQVNESMQLQIAVAISMALNPKLNVILMKGNDLDSESLATVCRMAKEKDYQVWIEKVSDDKQNRTGFIIEDGSVVDAEDVTVEPPRKHIDDAVEIPPAGDQSGKEAEELFKEEE